MSGDIAMSHTKCHYYPTSEITGITEKNIGSSTQVGTIYNNANNSKFASTYKECVIF